MSWAGYFVARYSYDMFYSYDKTIITDRLEDEAFRILCEERYPVDLEIYRLNLELSEELNVNYSYKNIHSGMLVAIRNDIQNYEENCD